MKSPHAPWQGRVGAANEQFCPEATGPAPFACPTWPCPPPPAGGLSWGPVRSHIALLRGSHRPDALVLLTLFPPKPRPGERRGWSTYYLASVGKVLDCFPPLVQAIAGDLDRLPGRSLGLVVNEPQPQPADWQPNTGNGANWGASNAHIGPCRWVFAECDREGFDLADQFALAIQVFGTEPSFTVSTGGKSLHCYFRLGVDVSPERFTELQKLVIATYERLAPGCKVDASLAKPAQVMRLAGGCHPRTGVLASIHTAANTSVCPEPLEGRLRGLLPVASAPGAHPPRPAAASAPGAPPPRPGLRRPQRVPLPSQRSAPPSLEQIREALEQIPPYASGQGRRDDFRRLVGGLRAAVLEAGGTEQQALDMCLKHSPGVLDADDYWRYDWTQITAGSLWYQAGWHPSRALQGGKR